MKAIIPTLKAFIYLALMPTLSAHAGTRFLCDATCVSIDYVNKMISIMPTPSGWSDADADEAFDELKRQCPVPYLAVKNEIAYDHSSKTTKETEQTSTVLSVNSTTHGFANVKRLFSKRTMAFENTQNTSSSSSSERIYLQVEDSFSYILTPATSDNACHPTEVPGTGTGVRFIDGKPVGS